MAVFYLSETPREIGELHYITEDSQVRAVAQSYYIDPVTLRVSLVWDLVTAWYEYEDGWAEQFEDSWQCKFEDQNG